MAERVNNVLSNPGPITGEDIEAAYEAFSVLKWRLDSARARRAS